jgi:transposase InsO family protein
MSQDQNAMLYAIIDDASRYVIGWEILATKQAASTCTVAKSAMKQYGKPFTFWTDNGGENRGKFKSYLQKHSVHSVFTEAYNSEQNGKIERFWQLLDFNCATRIELERFVRE